MSKEPAPGRAADAPKLVYLASSDPLDVRSFSGTLLHMVQALRALHPDMDVLRATRPRWFGRFRRAVVGATRGRDDPYYWPWLNRRFARRLARRWRGRRVLVIAVVDAPLAGELAALMPVVNISDSTFELMRGFYAFFDDYSERTVRAAEECERASIVRSVHNSFSSRWAADSAVRHYGARAEDVSAISWGCNMPAVPADRVGDDDADGDGPCRLLFLGGDWVRKGGDVVCATANILAARGFPVHVDIVGSRPADGLPDAPWIEDHGFLSKADPAQFARLDALIRGARFLFLPTRQDCTPMVFAEANAFGIPAVTRDVGGVGDVVRDGVNGLVLPESAGPEAFADAIEQAWRDRPRYRALRVSARRSYEERLNWPVWAEAITAVIRRLAAEGRV